MHSRLIAGSILALLCSLVASAGVKYGGVNIAGFDFGCSTDGTDDLNAVTPPLGGGNPDGLAQMQHFTTDDKLNIFRLPVGWQYLVNKQLGGPLDQTNFGKYDQLVQGCLKTGAYCIIDIHNYARWDGQIIGEGGPDPQAFANVWSQLAGNYKGESRVIMGLMNEPHDLTNVQGWASAVQLAVNAVRAAGATTQTILLPGNGYTGASTFASGGSGAALMGVTDPAGGTDKLIFDVHQYFDSDSSGTGNTCVSDKIADAFQPLATWLRQQNRQALVSELGGTSDPSCLQHVCAALDFFNQNSDVYAGYVGWAAGSFSTSYNLRLTPDGNQDVPLMTTCFAAKFQGGGGTGGDQPISTNSSSTTTTGSSGGSGTGSGTNGGTGSDGSGTGTGGTGSPTISSPPPGTGQGSAAGNATQTLPSRTCRPGRKSRKQRRKMDAAVPLKRRFN